MSDELFTPSLQDRDARYAKMRPWDLGSLFYVGLMMGIVPVTLLAVMSARSFGMPMKRQRRFILMAVAGLVGTLALGCVAGRLGGANARDWTAVVAVFGERFVASVLTIVFIRDLQTSDRTFHFYKQGRYRSILSLPDVWFAVPLFILCMAQLVATFAIVGLVLGW